MHVHNVYQTFFKRKSQETNYRELSFRSRQITNQRTTAQIARDLEKINVSQQVIDQQAILLKILVSSNNCTVVARRCCSIWTYSTLSLILSSQQGKAQQTMSTSTQESTYIAYALEEPTCYRRQVLHQRASQAVSMYVFRHVDSCTTGVEHPVAVNGKTNWYMWRYALP